MSLFIKHDKFSTKKSSSVLIVKEIMRTFYSHCGAPEGSRQGTVREGLSGLRTSELSPPSSLLGLAELAIENTPESACEAGESLLLFSRGDSGNKMVDYFKNVMQLKPTFAINRHSFTHTWRISSFTSKGEIMFTSTGFITICFS